jgi:hypothetical protein
MVEAGQLAPYKGSLPSADAKYAAGWAMKRCGAHAHTTVLSGAWLCLSRYSSELVQDDTFASAHTYFTCRLSARYIDN